MANPAVLQNIKDRATVPHFWVADYKWQQFLKKNSLLPESKPDTCTIITLKSSKEFGDVDKFDYNMNFTSILPADLPTDVQIKTNVTYTDTDVLYRIGDQLLKLAKNVRVDANSDWEQLLCNNATINHMLTSSLATSVRCVSAGYKDMFANTNTLCCYLLQTFIVHDDNIAEIRDVIYRVLGELTTTMGQLVEGLELKPHLVGSTAEGSKLFLPDEWDILLLTNPRHDHDQVVKAIIEGLHRLVVKYKHLSTTLRPILQRTGKVAMGLVLDWCPPRGQSFLVKLDLVLASRNPATKPAIDPLGNQFDFQQIDLIPIVPELVELKESAVLAEQRFLRMLPSVAKDALRILKLLFSAFRVWQNYESHRENKEIAMSSFVIKNALFWAIDTGNVTRRMLTPTDCSECSLMRSCQIAMQTARQLTLDRKYSQMYFGKYIGANIERDSFDQLACGVVIDLLSDIKPCPTHK